MALRGEEQPLLRVSVRRVASVEELHAWGENKE
jgi:hypothetical protein